MVAWYQMPQGSAQMRGTNKQERSNGFELVLIG